jgi:hypothetical protein
MGLIIEVYRHNHMFEADTTAGGISSTADMLFVENIDGPTKCIPAVRLVKHSERPPYDRTPLLVPVGTNGRGQFGRNFGYSSDSRFGRAVKQLTG